ncbi:hypothetical protein [Paenibacillus turpanensis]|uniref:hypothetical protein n=1 Tax=Paenibacillus turpanensis TaxID=2689078 RepID=UPI0014096D0B|nr:hypothetical protein [Paenibacillus turpanensis]
MRTFWAVAGNALVCALCLAVFSLLNDFSKYIFSLGAFFMGLRFFRNYDTWGVRWAFLGTTVALYFLLSIVYVAIAYVQGWPLPTMSS